MSMRKLSFIILLCAMSLLITSCGPGQILGTEFTPTPTPCLLVCNTYEDQVAIEITCESGNASCLANRGSIVGPGGLLEKRTRNDDCTYENSGNTYHIEGEINYGANKNVDNYHFEVTGGVFGDIPQICKFP